MILDFRGCGTRHDFWSFFERVGKNVSSNFQFSKSILRSVGEIFLGVLEVLKIFPGCRLSVFELSRVLNTPRFLRLFFKGVNTVLVRGAVSIEYQIHFLFILHPYNAVPANTVENHILDNRMGGVNDFFRFQSTETHSLLVLRRFSKFKLRRCLDGAFYRAYGKLYKI